MYIKLCWSIVPPLCIVGMTPTHMPEMMVATRHLHVLCLSNMKALTIIIYMRDERSTPFKSPTTIAFCVIISFHNFGLMIKFRAKGLHATSYTHKCSILDFKKQQIYCVCVSIYIYIIVDNSVFISYNKTSTLFGTNERSLIVH
jgi:hypothetical protein